KTKRSIIFPLLLGSFIILLLSVSFVGLYNLKQVKNKQQPIFIIKKEAYQEKNAYKTVYHMPLYKIIELREDLKITYSLKPFYDKD
ncbi:MAG: hypothetical protein RSE91_02655, partial [Bacilli bacterium]